MSSNRILFVLPFAFLPLIFPSSITNAFLPPLPLNMCQLHCLPNGEYGRQTFWPTFNFTQLLFLADHGIVYTHVETESESNYCYLPVRCIKLTRASSEGGYAGSEAASELWMWLQHNESVTVNAKQSGYIAMLSVLLLLLSLLSLSLAKGQNRLHQFFHSKSVTSWRPPCNKSTSSPQHKWQVPNKLAQASVVFGKRHNTNSSTMICFGLIGHVANNSATSSQLPHTGKLRGNVMDFWH